MAITVVVVVIVGILMQRRLNEERRLETQRQLEAQRRREEERRLETQRRLDEERRLEEAEEQRRRDAIAADRSQKVQQILATSSSWDVRGYRIVRQLEMVTHSVTQDEEEAKRELKIKAATLGANGIVRMKISRSQGGYVSIQGDAVILQEGV